MFFAPYSSAGPFNFYGMSIWLYDVAILLNDTILHLGLRCAELDLDRDTDQCTVRYHLNPWSYSDAVQVLTGILCIANNIVATCYFLIWKHVVTHGAYFPWLTLYIPIIVIYMRWLSKILDWNVSRITTWCIASTWVFRNAGNSIWSCTPTVCLRWQRSVPTLSCNVCPVATQDTACL